MEQPFKLSDEQRRRALEAAKQVRKERKEIRVKIYNGEISVSEALDLPVLQRVKVDSFIRYFRGIGEVKCQQIMRAAEIAEGRRVKGLGARQRERLIALIDGAVE